MLRGYHGVGLLGPLLISDAMAWFGKKLLHVGGPQIISIFEIENRTRCVLDYIGM